MRTEDFDYVLPPALIAQTPAPRRRSAKMLVLGHPKASLLDQCFSDIEQFCAPGDLLVLNDTQVIPARLHCHKPSGGQVELMLERVVNKTEFLALTRSNKKLKVGQILCVGNSDTFEYLRREGEFFRYKLLAKAGGNVSNIFLNLGKVPLPPYIKRQPNNEDADRYQTVYANVQGAVAAPTAGLHFDQQMLDQLKRRGVGHEVITLHVGAGTFQPVKVNEISAHTMHQEWINVSPETVNRIKQTKAANKRVIAVGTTTVRALEAAALDGGLKPYQGDTNIFIYPGFKFKVVDALLTNFHLPKSTLLMMISAFAGLNTIRAAYAHAIQQKYRFFSYGDAMLIFPPPGGASK